MDAALGDDGYGEDATVNRLQELAAEKLGMEAGLSMFPAGQWATPVRYSRTPAQGTMSFSRNAPICSPEREANLPSSMG